MHRLQNPPSGSVEVLLLDSTGHPWPGMPVRIEVTGFCVRDLRFQETTDEDGICRFEKVPQGMARVTIERSSQEDSSRAAAGEAARSQPKADGGLTDAPVEDELLHNDDEAETDER